MDDRNLEYDEQRRIRQHEAVKAELDRDVTERLADRASVHDRPADAVRIDRAAERLHARAVDEAVSTEHELDRARGAARVSQVVDYLFFVIYALLGLRALLALMGANPGSGFVRFVRQASGPFYAPFEGIVGSPSVDGYTLALPILVALVAYAVLHTAINRLLRLAVHRKTAV